MTARMMRLVILASILLSCGGGNPSPDDAEQPEAVSQTALAARNFLAAQLRASQRTTEKVQQAKDAGDLAAAQEALHQREVQWPSAIQHVRDGLDSGLFYKDDAALLMTPLEEELTGMIALQEAVR